MCETAVPVRQEACPECADEAARCPATAVRLVHADALTACTSSVVGCALPAGHDGRHRSAPTASRSLLGHRRWTTFRW